MTPAYLTTAQVAETYFGWSASFFREKRGELVKAGFPEKDPLTRRYLRMDVEAFLNSRRRIRDADEESGQARPASGINLDAV